MRMRVLLATAAGLLLAAEPPEDDGGRDQAEKWFRALEEKLAKAKTLRCAFDVRLDTHSYKGSLVLAEGNRARLEIHEATEGRPVRVLVVSDGTRLSYQDNGMGRPRLEDTPASLNADILTWVAHPGVFLPQAPLPDVRADDAKDRFRVSGFRLGGEEKAGGGRARRLEYQLAVRGHDGPFSVVVWLDRATWLPVKRLVTSRTGGHQTVVEETYGKLVLDEKVDAKKFELPE